MIAAFIVTLALSIGSVSLIVQVVPMNDARRTLNELFEDDWQWRLQNYPEVATLLGDNRYNDRLTDLSRGAIEARKAHDRDMLSRIRSINRSQLSGQDIISFDLFLRDKQLDVEGQRFPVELAPITQMQGPHIEFPQLVGMTPFRTAKDYEAYLSRLAAFPKYIDQVIALMEQGMRSEWVPPAAPLRSVPSQIEGQIVADPSRSHYYKPFLAIPREVGDQNRSRLRELGKTAVAERVMPALRKLDTFIKQTYLPSCRKDIAASALPQGKLFYDYAIKRHTTTRLSAEEIHHIGKHEVDRIRNEMSELIKRAGYQGSFQEFLQFLRTDSRFYYDKPEDMVAGYSYIAKRADGGLPQLFAELPRLPYGVREIPEYEAPAQTTAYYQPGAADGSRAADFWVNTYKLNTRPKYEMEALSLHEAVPGHHVQIARAQELKGLPDFRRNAGYTAYVEGWALYAESLGEEMGFYTDPYSKFGQLTYEMWRACRLVIDTGMHALGWSRQQAIDYMKGNAAKTENDIIVEVDRYIVWPGQALAYKIGELKIKELRVKAQREIGEGFDVRRFHNALLDDGPLPLDILEERITHWISVQNRKAEK